MADDPTLGGEFGSDDRVGQPPDSRAAEKLGIDPVKPITLLGVASLGEPDLRVEVEATAVLP
ncbi:hypothetical protein ACIG56_28820 [Nocardia fusca]|uniref:hypothetical protein n=1 Tax=Nocardia fusca TaxID=941183 RepID=UPI0037C72874